DSTPRLLGGFLLVLALSTTAMANAGAAQRACRSCSVRPAQSSSSRGSRGGNTPMFASSGRSDTRISENGMTRTTTTHGGAGPTVPQIRRDSTSGRATSTRVPQDMLYGEPVNVINQRTNRGETWYQVQRPNQSQTAWFPSGAVKRGANRGYIPTMSHNTNTALNSNDPLDSYARRIAENLISNADQYRIGILSERVTGNGKQFVGLDGQMYLVRSSYR
ncbi:MAG: hypothetical protein ABI743_12800, partial [bacterium]